MTWRKWKCSTDSFSFFFFLYIFKRYKQGSPYGSSTQNWSSYISLQHIVWSQGNSKIIGVNVQDWSPQMSFILKGSRISTLQLEGWFKSKMSIQVYGNEIQNSYWTCARIMWYMLPIQCEELRVNHLTLLLCIDKCPTLVGSCAEWYILRTSSDVFVFNSGLHFEGLFWERYMLKGPNRIWRALKTLILNNRLRHQVARCFVIILIIFPYIYVYSIRDMCNVLASNSRWVG